MSKYMLCFGEKGFKKVPEKMWESGT